MIGIGGKTTPDHIRQEYDQLIQYVIDDDHAQTKTGYSAQAFPFDTSYGNSDLSTSPIEIYSDMLSVQI